MLFFPKREGRPVDTMKGFLVILWCLAVASGFVLNVDEDGNQWKAWKDFHGKTYARESEETTRKAIWRDNLKVILLPKRF